MEFTDCHFTYAGVSSRRFGMKFVNCSTSRYSTLNGTAKTVTAFSARGNRNFYVADSFADSPVSFDAEIMTDRETPLSVNEMRDIEQWLFNRKGFYKLYIDTADDCLEESYEIINGEMKQYYINCRMTKPSKLEGNGGIVGFKFTIETDSCLAWQDAITKTITPAYGTGTSATFTLDVDTDMFDYIYPKVKFTMGSTGGDFSLTNQTDSSTRLTSFGNMSALATVTMDGNYNSLTGDSSSYYTKFVNRNFVRLLPGTNTFTVTGDVASIQFTYSQRRYL